MASHPAWGEWIEILGFVVLSIVSASHPAWGEWIEIATLWPVDVFTSGLTPHGVSGLKLWYRHTVFQRPQSHPAWGEWIEIIPPA